MTLRYPIGASGQTIHLTPEVLAHFHRHRQVSRWQAEAGGQMFARLDGVEIVVELVTGPKASDRRSRTSHASRRSFAQAEADAMHRLGLHYVGDWHSHPERRPNPSWRDRMTMASRGRRSRHWLNGFVFIIVGTEAFPAGLAVIVHDGTRGHRLAADQRETR